MLRCLDHSFGKTTRSNPFAFPNREPTRKEGSKDVDYHACGRNRLASPPRLWQSPALQSHHGPVFTQPLKSPLGIARNQSCLLEGLLVKSLGPNFSRILQKGSVPGPIPFHLG